MKAIIGKKVGMSQIFDENGKALGTDRLLCRRNPRRPHASQPTVG